MFKAPTCIYNAFFKFLQGADGIPGEVGPQGDKVTTLYSESILGTNYFTKKMDVIYNTIQNFISLTYPRGS